MNLMGVNDEIKMFCVDTKNGYDVSLSATESGDLEFAVRYYDGKGNLYDERMVTDVEVTGETKISVNVNKTEETVLEIDTDGDGNVDTTMIVDGSGNGEEPGEDDHTHEYGEPDFVWADDYKSATATFVCKDYDSYQDVEAEVTKEVVVEPTETEAGQMLYTATVTFEGKTYTDTKIIEIPAGTIMEVSSFKAVNQANSIKLTWEASENVDGYLVYRRTNESSYKVVTTIRDSEKTSFVDENVANGIRYYYNIAAFKNTEDGRRVGTKRSLATQILRTKITSVTNQNGSVKISWTKAEGVAGYKVWRKADGQEKYYRIATLEGAGKTSYTDKAEKAIVNGKKSQYYIVPYYKNSSNVVTKTSVKTNYYLKKETISSVETKGSKALKVKWKKNNKATGYQVRYSTSKSFDSYKTAKLTSKNTLSKTLKDLKKSKTYYVKVRAYKTVNGTTYYSAWSNVKTKKTK